MKPNELEALPVKIGLQALDKKMTRKQAEQYGWKVMQLDIRRAGFVCSVYRTDKEIHGGEWFRINYSK